MDTNNSINSLPEVTRLVIPSVMDRDDIRDVQISFQDNGKTLKIFFNTGNLEASESHRKNFVKSMMK